MSASALQFDLFGSSVEVIRHRSTNHPRAQVIPPATNWRLVVQTGDPFLNQFLHEEPTCAWFGPRTFAEIVYPSKIVEVTVISFPLALSETISRYLQSPILNGFSASTLSVEFGSDLYTIQHTLEAVLKSHMLKAGKVLATKSDRTLRFRHLNKFGLSKRSRMQIERVTSAAHAITTSSKPLSDIAIENGFYDQPHMNRTFRRYFPFSPNFLRDHAVGGPALYLDVAETYKKVMQRRS